MDGLGLDCEWRCNNGMPRLARPGLSSVMMAPTGRHLPIHDSKSTVCLNVRECAMQCRPSSMSIVARANRCQPLPSAPFAALGRFDRLVAAIADFVVCHSKARHEF